MTTDWFCAAEGEEVLVRGPAFERFAEFGLKCVEGDDVVPAVVVATAAVVGVIADAVAVVALFAVAVAFGVTDVAGFLFDTAGGGCGASSFGESGVETWTNARRTTRTLTVFMVILQP